MAYGERTVSGDQQRNLNDQINLQEQRLEYFMNHYLPKQEVLYRLPLNIPISSFWQELLERRKAGAILLPLHNGLGKPYWYTLTPKMITASERLSQEVMMQEKRLDPYQMKMTSAMTQEMYFTSYVEGAEISIDDAMEFLSRGTPPENVLEQLIWNNRQAWEWMIRNLYRSINEESLHFLAYTLTDGMENAAEEYRQTDSHPIPAMQNESYTVPPAARIPALMYEYSRFMNDPGVHPLIKTSVGAAFLLVTRPFPEGNERLSRMISSMVLLRSGYGYFSDISLSSVIAKETWPYYQNLCEIMREDNDGDLTYFMEYFLEMLVRALEQMQSRDKENNEDLLHREYEMSREPLQASEQTQMPPTTPVVASSSTETLPIGEDIESGEEKNVASEESPPEPREELLIPDVEDPMWLTEIFKSIISRQPNRGSRSTYKVERELARIWLNEILIDGLASSLKKKLNKYLMDGGIRAIRLTAFFVQGIANDQTVFRAKDYRKILQVSKEISTSDLRIAREIGLVRTLGKSGQMLYIIINGTDKQIYKLESPATIQLEEGISGKREQEILNLVRDRIGREEFTMRSASEKLHIEIKHIDFHIRKLYKKGFLQRKMVDNRYVYWLTKEETTLTEEQAERLRARLEQKHPPRVDVPQSTALVVAG